MTSSYLRRRRQPSKGGGTEMACGWYQLSMTTRSPLASTSQSPQWACMNYQAQKKCEISPCGFGTSHSSYATYRGPTWQPSHVSRFDTTKYIATLSRIGRDSKRPHEANKTGCQINKNSGHGCNAWFQTAARCQTQRIVPDGG